MKQIIAIFLICLVIAAGIFIFVKNIEKEEPVTYDVYKMISDTLNIPNISLEKTTIPELNGIISVKYSKNNKLLKIEEKLNNKKNTVTIINNYKNTMIVYDTDTKQGVELNLNKSSASTSYISEAYREIINIQKDLEYEIMKENIDNIECIKVIFKYKGNQNIYATIWFEVNSQIIIQTQSEGTYDNNTNIVTKYKNIKQNSVGEDYFKIPDDIKIKELTIED